MERMTPQTEEATMSTATKISTFDRTTCRTIQAEALKALEEVAACYGLAVKANSGSFSSSSLKASFSAVVQASVPKDFAAPASEVPGRRQAGQGRPDVQADRPVRLDEPQVRREVVMPRDARLPLHAPEPPREPPPGWRPPTGRGSGSDPEASRSGVIVIDLVGGDDEDDGWTQI